MDEEKARELEKRLRGEKVGQWTINNYIDHGKSAAVFHATGPDGEVAVKIFDDELIKKYGDGTQFERIKREIGLVGKSHPNLVPILGGGYDSTAGNHFVAMEYLAGPNLKKALQSIPTENVAKLIEQLASAAKFLEDLGYCHRDIKPENIIILDNYARLVLLDLGVIRPITGSSLTDVAGVHPFVGTLQYSSPEFLLRQEDDCLEGWRALTFYQIGGVLHDLIMRRALFADFAEPYARLVNAVQHEIPAIQNSAVPARLVDLARSCLLKNWRTRLRFVDWDAFRDRAPNDPATGSARQRVTTRGAIAQAEAKSTQAALDPQQAERLSWETITFLEACVRAIRSENPVIPPIKFLKDNSDGSSFCVELRAAPEFGLNRDLYIEVKVEVIDALDRAVAISARACVGKRPEASDAPTNWGTVYQGVHDASGIETAIDESVYDLIDQAQNTPEDTFPIFLTPTPLEK